MGRRLLISSSTDLAELHQVIQIAMGWSNSDLHQLPLTISSSESDTEYGDSLTGTGKTDVLLKHENQWITYEYDFGDSWEHKILLEKILLFQPEAVGPRCIDGRRSCPPEDVGGAWGYQEFLGKPTQTAAPGSMGKRWSGSAMVSIPSTSTSTRSTKTEGDA